MKSSPIKNLRFQGLKREHINKWVAVAQSSGKLIGVANSLAEVLHRSESVKEKTVFKVLPQVFVGITQ